MDLGLEGKVALVTGGSKGVGRDASEALVAEGCHVSICSRNEEEVRRAAGGEMMEQAARQQGISIDEAIGQFLKNKLVALEPGPASHPGRSPGS